MCYEMCQFILFFGTGGGDLARGSGRRAA